MNRQNKMSRDPVDLVYEVYNRITRSKEICYDCETSGLDFKRNHIVGHVFNFGPAPQDSYYVPVRHAAGGNWRNEKGPQVKDGWNGEFLQVEQSLIGAMDQQDKTVFGHNLAFDLKFLSRVGYKMRPRHEDTMINAPLLDEWQGKFSLAFCAGVAGVENKKIKIIEDHIRSKFPEATDKDYMGHLWRLAGDDPIAVEYAAGDGVTTWQLRDWQMPQLEKQELTRVWDVESRLIPVLARMSIKGIKIDEERLNWLKDYLNSEINERLTKFPPEFNARSSADVQKWCELNGVTNWPLTQHRINPKPSFPESWLITNEPGRQVVAVRKFMTLRDSFVMPMIETHLFNGRVHTEFNQLRGDEYGTITGRLSSSNPNLQQVSKRDKILAPLYRSIFVPDEGMLWGSTDYRQCEPTLLAYYSHAKVLVDGFLSDPPVNPHQAVADQTGMEYNNAKRLNQMIITGGGPRGMAKKFGLDEKFAKDMYDKYHKALPEVGNLQRRAAHVFRQRGYVLSLMGRRARINNPELAYQACNRLLQCGNADIIKSSMVRIDDYLESEGRPIDLLNNVHDSLDDQFREEDRKHHKECLRIMTDFGPGAPIEIDMPIRIDVGEGKNWAEATFGTGDD